MPNKAWPGRSVNAFRDRFAHRIDKRMLSAACVSVAECGVHSSKHIVISDPKFSCIFMELSGVMTHFEPST